MKDNNIFSTDRAKAILQEEMGIAKQVVAYSNEIFDKIKKGEASFVLDNGVIVEYGNIEGLCGYSKDNNTLYISKDESATDFLLKSQISHEVEHMWQVMNKRGGLSTSPYQVAIDGIKRGYGSYQAICLLYYYSRKFEIDAFCNGVYASEYGADCYETFEEFVKNTELGQIFSRYQYLQNYFSDIEFEEPEFKWSWNTFCTKSNIKPKGEPKAIILKLLLKGYDYLLKKSARIYSMLISENRNKKEKLTEEQLKGHQKLTAAARHFRLKPYSDVIF